MADARLRRSMLMTPGNRLERLQKAARHGADVVVFDLEDGVPPDAKLQARALVSQALRQMEPGGCERCVRINALASGLGADDIASLPLELIDSIMLPKVESAAGLIEVQRHLEALGCDRGRETALELVVTLETPRGLLQALQIADASPRTSALFFGSGDYSAATGGALIELSLLYPRSVVAAAAGAVSIQAIDAAFFQDVRNAEATRADARVARDLGFAGKVVFHPAQVAVVNEVFSPTEAEIERARRIVAAYDQGLARGHGTTLAGELFVAIDLVAPAQRLLRRAAQVRARDGGDPRPPQTCPAGRPSE